MKHYTYRSKLLTAIEILVNKAYHTTVSYSGISYEA